MIEFCVDPGLMELLNGDNDDQITAQTSSSSSKGDETNVLPGGGKGGEPNKVGAVNSSEASSLVTILQAQRDRYKDRLGNVCSQ